jgi:cytochrome c biogenesis protein CcmG/thiol:disulfide interchange protein DsbE
MKLRLALVSSLVMLASACGGGEPLVTATTADPETETTQAISVDETYPVQVNGDVLAPPPQGGEADPAIGTLAPTLTGTDINGDPITIGDDGRAKAIVFVAHWCPHCQAEVPVIAELVANGDVPDNMDLYIVSTAVFDDRDNYPATDWLRSSGLDAPIMLDAKSFDGLVAFGAGAFPYSVYLNSSNKVVNRFQGSASPETIKGLWLETAGA